jgi:uncharacterized protein YecE (DUF72 family)
VIKCGIAGWIDKSLIESGRFYPAGCTSSEDRLRFYATQFDVVEADTMYYGLPVRKTSEQWVARTPDGFKFDVKAFSLFTHHPTKAAALTKELRAELPPELLERNLYIEKTPAAVVDAAWEQFRDAVEPLRAAGKLGAVLLQFPRWFLPSGRSLSYIEECQERMFGFTIAVEFRNREWLDDRHATGTLHFLRARQIPYVAVDAPQGFADALPPVAEATSDRFAIVRFHGRNTEKWSVKGAPPWVRFRYRYSEGELGEWAPRLEELERSAPEVHAIMNNNFSSYSVENARELMALLNRRRAARLP